MGKEISVMKFQLQRLVSNGTTSYADLVVNDDNGAKNNLFLYGGWTNAVMHTGERHGLCRIQFSKVYHIQVYVSETFEDPNASNCTWSLTSFSKVMTLNPLD